MTIINTQKLYLRWLGMLLASAPLRKWSLLSSRPTSRAHDGSLRQGDPTGRRKLTTHLGSIHSPDRPLIQHPSTHQITQHGSTHWITQYLSTHSASIYSPRIESVTCNLLQPTSNQNGTDIMNQRLTCGPRALHLPCLVKQCLVYLVYPLRSNYCTWSTVSHPTAAHQAVSLTSASPQVSSSTYR